MRSHIIYLYLRFVEFECCMCLGVYVKNRYLFEDLKNPYLFI